MSVQLNKKIYKNERPIAILLAVYNGADYFEEQLDSILNQTNKDWTLYIRDDKSTDRTVEIIKRYSDKYPQIIPITDNDGNLGCRNNFFRLLDVVDSEYYMFSDADDVWLDFKVQLAYDTISSISNPKNFPVIAHSNFSVTDKDLNIRIDDYWKETHFKPERFYSPNLIAIANPIGGAETIFNHRLKELMFPLSDNGLMHDRWLPFVAAKNNAIIKPIYKPTRLYRMHGNNLYGIKTEKPKSMAGRIEESYRLNKYTADKLIDAGYGSYAKYIWYKLIYTIKRKL